LLSGICAEKGVALIEDAAHAAGASYKGRPCGTLADAACFSFFSNKNLAVGEGGMFVSGREDLCRRVELMRSHGMTSGSEERYRGRTFGYDVITEGLNYRIDEIRSALGLVQLGKLDSMNTRRRELHMLYLEELAGVEGLSVPFMGVEEPDASSFHIFPVLLDKAEDREPFMKALREQGVQTSIHYPAFDEFSAYENEFPDYPVMAKDVSGRMVTLPLYPGMRHEDVALVSSAIRNFFCRRRCAA
jgi:dTDP-4-amino-4,6-dideoxygalactose transaminase